MHLTQDLYLAASLMTAGHRLKDVTHEGRRATFVFEDSPALRDTVALYFSGELALDARALSETVRSLKAAAMAGAPTGAR
jgi:hypothetical protein